MSLELAIQVALGAEDGEVMVRINEHGRVSCDVRNEAGSGVWTPVAIQGGHHRVLMSDGAGSRVMGEDIDQDFHVVIGGRLDVCPTCRSVHAIEGSCWAEQE